jgi:hypothetical protein
VNVDFALRTDDFALLSYFLGYSGGDVDFIVLNSVKNEFPLALSIYQFGLAQHAKVLGGYSLFYLEGLKNVIYTGGFAFVNILKHPDAQWVRQRAHNSSANLQPLPVDGRKKG